MRTLQSGGERLDLETVGALNDKIAAGDMSHLILIQEALQEKTDRRDRGADRRAGRNCQDRYDRRSVFLWKDNIFPSACPCSLEAIGLKPHPIAVDNYFVNRVDSPRDENGNYNYEVLECLDVDMFNQDMTDLLAGKTVEMPYYNFVKGQREYQGRFSDSWDRMIYW